jgi:hypothetical protein
MFHTIRRWWGDGGKSTLRLFLFEFLVVMAGVLAAQWLQQRQQELALRGEARDLLANSQRIHEDIIARSLHWHRYGPCVMARAEEIARAAGDGRTLTRAEIGRPALPSTDIVNWPPALVRAAIDLVGSRKMADYQDLEANAVISDNVTDRISRDWATFNLLDPAYGKPSAQDFANVRLAAVRVANDLRLLQLKYLEDKALADRLGLKPLPSGGEVRFDNCGMIRNWK